MKVYLSEAVSLVAEALFGPPQEAFAVCDRQPWLGACNTCGSCGTMKRKFWYMCLGCDACPGCGSCYKCLCEYC